MKILKVSFHTWNMNDRWMKLIGTQWCNWQRINKSHFKQFIIKLTLTINPIGICLTIVIRPILTTIQWCRKVKNFGGASSNRLGVSWFVKYWRGQWPPLPPSSGITENYPYLLPLAPPIFFIFRHHCTRKLDHAFHSAFYEIFNSYYYDSTQSKVYTSGI